MKIYMDERYYLHPMTPLLDIYKASAGSGKTHLLTLKFVSLLLTNPDAYKKILAVTFTNKATAEMKDRILTELARLAIKENTQLGKQLVEMGLVPDMGTLQKLAADVYTNILHDYSRFSVSTIDAFTQKMIRNCSWELGIDADFTLQLNGEVVSNDLATRLFEKIDTPGYEALRRQMADLATERVDSGKSWDFKDELVKMAKMLFSEAYLNFESRLVKAGVHQENAFKDLKKAVYATVQAIEQEWERLAMEGQGILNRYGLTPDDFSYKQGGIGGRFDAALKKMDNPADSQRVKNIIDGHAAPYPKSADPSLKAQIDAAIPEILSAIEGMDRFYKREMPKYFTAKSIKANLNYVQLILLMGNELAAWRKENNALLISDTHNLLRQLSTETTPEFIYEKIGNRYQHFLLDEFQDTSDFQYHNFKPLLNNSMAEGGYNLVVGDVKQAIYRWRNGDWQLLHSRLPNDFASFKPNLNTLTYNYRSAVPIIRFNNYLFTILPQLIQTQLLAALGAAPEAIRDNLISAYGSLLTDAYADSVQEIPLSSSESGNVSVRFYDKKELASESDEGGFDQAILERVHETVNGLLKEGHSPGDIAILCRSNAQARKTIEHLMIFQQREGAESYPLLSADALRISSNGMVQLIIAVMQWLLDESNRLAETIIRQFKVRQDGGDADSFYVFMKSKGLKEALPPELVHQKQRLCMLPVPELVNEIIVLLELKKYSEDLPYLLSFLDLVHNWVRYSDEGIQAFLQYWEEEGLQETLPAAAKSDAVEVVTIHKSKGLAYTIVLMPFCNWALAPESNKGIILWADMQETGFPQIPVLPVYYKNDLAASELAPFYFTEMVNSYLDNLNLLYVAMTRARSRLIIWAPLPGKSKTGDVDYSTLKNMHHLLYAAAVSDAVDSDVPKGFDQEAGIWEYGTLSGQVPQKENELNIPPDLHFESWRLQRGLVLRKSVDVEEDNTGKLARSQGILLHEMLAKITHPGKWQKVLGEMESAGKISSVQKEDYTVVLTELLKLEPFEGWMTGTVSRLSERAMILPGGELRRPDLILYNDKETKVIDFKFTEIKEKVHVEQVQQYKSWLEKMGFPEVQGFLVYGFQKEVVFC